MAEGHAPSAVRLRPATGEDGFLLRRWLSDPATQACSGNRASAEAEIALARLSETALRRIVTCEARPIGYALAMEPAAAAGAQAAEVPPGTWETQLWIAPSRAGVLAAIPALLAAEVFATTLAIACSGLISIRQEMMVRAYERAGFRWRRIWHDPLFGPAWLMLKERPPARA
jgi:Acetyltransferase (GNAT) domain